MSGQCDFDTIVYVKPLGVMIHLRKWRVSHSDFCDGDTKYRGTYLLGTERDTGHETPCFIKVLEGIIFVDGVTVVYLAPAFLFFDFVAGRDSVRD